ncbi:MAG: RNA polymerase-binding protein DksA [Alphaproteobacteria bacterium]|nr:RNA polymerase-binding protein DksA [Alphaproteobacteria bacterium]
MKTELESDYIPSEKEEYMCKKHLEYFKKKLNAWKQELIDEAQQTMSHLKEDKLNEPDPSDRAMAETEAAFELRSRGRYRKLITKIDHALERIEDGSYGYCEETGEPIGVRRLDARPVATLCIEAQEKHENFERQHSED